MTTYQAVLLIAFVAAALAVEGFHALWYARHGPEAARLARRLRLMEGARGGDEAISVLKTRHWERLSSFERLLLNLPGGRALDQLLMQAGSAATLGRLFWRMVGFFIIGVMAAGLLGRTLGHGTAPWLGSLVLGLAAASLPVLMVVRAKHRRMAAMLLQLPEALDLVGRAMRAGHAFSGGLKMVADELRDPIGGEFRTTFEELNLGLSVENAMLNMAERIDLPDMKFFVVTVLIQRDSGGNLAEILDKISRLIRERIRLFGRVRVLATQGRLEAWILTVLPFIVAAIMSVIAPTMISVLWKDPAGQTMLALTGTMMLAGIFVMWRMVHIRV